MRQFQNDLAIIGTGRVGLPLGISLASTGLRVIGIDVDEKLNEKINSKVFPFAEPGYDELIRKVDFKCYNDVSLVKDCENIIITVGTPLTSHIETDLSQVRRVVSSLVPYLTEGHNIMLRSTIAPQTTEFVKNYLEQKTTLIVGKDIFLSFCPERLAEGKAMTELRKLPQIIGSEDQGSAERAETLFARLAEEVIHTDYVSAELTKLFNNISRYIYFSIANQFAIIADNFGANIYDIVEMTNRKYPRGVIPAPGLTAGTCLRKDFGMINESIPYTDLLLSAWKVNEFMPKFLVDGMKKRINILKKKVAVLGYTFKKDVDDARDSLVPKLLRYLERENPSKISVHEPNLGCQLDGIYENEPIEAALANADIVYIGINHSGFAEKSAEILTSCGDNVWFADIWNVCGQNRIFFQNPRKMQTDEKGFSYGGSRIHRLSPRETTLR